MEKCNTIETSNASVVRGTSITENMQAKGRFDFICYDKDGNVKWTDYSNNIVTNQGKNNMLDTYLGLATLPPAWYMSLITAGTAISTSTYASPTVTEITSGVITSNTRVTMGWSAASAGAKAATTTSFTVTGTATVTGNMVVTGGSGASTVGNTGATGGVLFSSSAFSGGSKNISSGDTLNCTYSLSV